MTSRFFATCLLLLLAFPSAGFSAEQPADAYHTLVTAGMFSFGGIGYAGTIAQPELAWRKIVHSVQPAEVFMKILEHGTPPAKMYALCGLYFTNREAYQKAVAPYRTSHDTFEMAAGCMIMPSTYPSQIRNLEEKRYDNVLKDLPKH